MTEKPVFDIDTFHTSYINRHSKYAEELAALNIDVDAPVESVNKKIVLVNCEELQFDFFAEKAKREINGEVFNQEKENILKADIFKGYLKQNGLLEDGSYLEKVLAGETDKISLKDANEILAYRFDGAKSNTDYMGKIFGIGDAQMIFTENKEADAVKGYSLALNQLDPEVKKDIERLGLNLPLILKERGRLHETMHTLGTKDERKCDTFALLKVLKDNPHPAVAELFINSRINSMSSAINKFTKNFDGTEKESSTNWGSYLMPRTLKKIRAFANDPQQLKSLQTMSDTDMINLTKQWTKEAEFSKEEWAQFKKDVTANNGRPLSKAQLMNCAILKEVMELAGDKNIRGKMNFLEKRFDSTRQETEDAVKTKDNSKFNSSEYFGYLDELKDKYPNLNGKELQKALSVMIIKTQMEKAGQVCDRNMKSPAVCFDPKQQAENKREIEGYYANCNKASTLSNNVMKSYEVQKANISQLSSAKAND